MSYRKVTEFKTVAEFANYVKSERFSFGVAPEVPADGSAALARPLECFGRTIGNRWAILPMEGWDCQVDGTPSEFTRRRWLRFAASGAKLIYGVEAGAVMHSGRSNPRQLLVDEHTLPALRELCREMRRTHREKFGTDDDLAIGLQLTHSGRFSHPNRDDRLEPRTAYAHPLLDRKFGCSAANVVTDDEVGKIVHCFVRAARVAYEAGFDFVDVKHAHGYLAHELLTAVDRPGRYGGSFENRTRFFREIAAGIRAEVPRLALSARLSLFDIMPFVKGEDGVGRPMEWQGPYPYAFGGDGGGLEMDRDLKDLVRFAGVLKEFGVGLICATIGSPYYNVHMQRPAYYPVCDGYEMPEHPLYNVGRHILAVRRFKELCPDLLVVGSGYSCLQEYLPNVAEHSLRHGWTDFVGIGRMVLSYPEICADVLAGRPLDRRRICRTFGDCTNAPRHGMISGCYPLDDFYKCRAEAARLKAIKQGNQKVMI